MDLKTKTRKLTDRRNINVRHFHVDIVATLEEILG